MLPDDVQRRILDFARPKHPETDYVSPDVLAMESDYKRLVLYCTRTFIEDLEYKIRENTKSLRLLSKAQVSDISITFFNDEQIEVILNAGDTSVSTIVRRGLIRPFRILKPLLEDEVDDITITINDISKKAFMYLIERIYNKVEKDNEQYYADILYLKSSKVLELSMQRYTGDDGEQIDISFRLEKFKKYSGKSKRSRQSKRISLLSSEREKTMMNSIVGEDEIDEFATYFPQVYELLEEDVYVLISYDSLRGKYGIFLDDSYDDDYDF